MIKGWIQRRRYRIHQINNEDTHRYFKQVEAYETLTRDKFDPNAPVESRSFTYSTGAVYTGEWKGNMRHGRGKMTWSDQACYEGNWSYNMASGKGTFRHVSGDVYTGNWVNSKCHGHGTYITAKGANYEGDWK